MTMSPSIETERSLPADIRARTKILVVEDNVLNQKLDAFLLSNWNMRFDICDNGQKAVEMLSAEPYDLVLMDIRMPVLDGYEATRVIRSQLGLAVPVIGITAHPTNEEKERCLANGMNNYIVKPVDEEGLFRLICSYLLPEQVENAADEE